MENQNIQLPTISKAAYDRLNKFIQEPGFVDFAIHETCAAKCKPSLLTYILLRNEQLKTA